MLTLTKDAVINILRWAEQHADVEVTGFVAEGPAGQRVQPMTNVASHPDRFYDWDPIEMMKRYGEMDGADERPVAIYHSHPSGRREPSETDMQGALNVGLHYVIAYPNYLHHHDDGPVWRLSVWECIDMGILVESEYEVRG
jgi:proteasome lid subunit RPN8/RPN11